MRKWFKRKTKIHKTKGHRKRTKERNSKDIDMVIKLLSFPFHRCSVRLCPVLYPVTCCSCTRTWETGERKTIKKLKLLFLSFSFETKRSLQTRKVLLLVNFAFISLYKYTHSKQTPPSEALKSRRRIMLVTRKFVKVLTSFLGTLL